MNSIIEILVFPVNGYVRKKIGLLIKLTIVVKLQRTSLTEEKGKTMRITKEAVIQTASDIADKDGLDHVSLKVVAEKLNIRTPSLYNHIDSLDDLLKEIAHRGMREMNAQMMQAAVGNSGDAAIKLIGAAYFNFLLAHPGVYETIQWAGWHGNAE